MILEVAILQVKTGLTEEFEQNFKIASGIISKMKGYVNHEIQKCMEDTNKYILLVHWNTLEDHTIGFRKSEEYQEWKKLLHPFYDPFPTVEHYKKIDLNEAAEPPVSIRRGKPKINNTK
ncbi:antibiotic biosynthesis monooxygenase family protein [Paenibacillus mesotrionivorans]|uniref:Antibiotic biosynthesis monooxygenase family protein n=1 Tax=Paenibacillus mesotrionivorans TaxID=3160968 RepID=A0ACC7NZ80_9BACL